MANLSHIRSKAQLIGTLNPKAWDALKPHTPFVFSNAHVELMVADAVKLVAGAITDKGLAREVMELSRTMAKQAGGALIASWEPGDELCPPWPWPWPGPRPWWLDVFGPQPEPWKAVLAAEQVELAHILTQLSGLTTSKEFNGALKGVATKVAAVASATLLDEFERCGTVPRKPFPPRKAGVLT
jgi:hypothetical protein